MDDVQILSTPTLVAEVATAWPMECAAHPEVTRDEKRRLVLTVHLVPLPDSVDDLPKAGEWAAAAFARAIIRDGLLELRLLSKQGDDKPDVVARWRDPRIELGTVRGEETVVHYLRNIAAALRLGAEVGLYAAGSEAETLGVWDGDLAARPLAVLIYRAPDLPTQWIGHCLDLDVVSQGDSPADAFKMVSEAVDLVVADDRAQGLHPLGRQAAPLSWRSVHGEMLLTPEHELPTSNPPAIEDRTFALRIIVELPVAPVSEA